MKLAEQNIKRTYINKFVRSNTVHSNSTLKKTCRCIFYSAVFSVFPFFLSPYASTAQAAVKTDAIMINGTVLSYTDETVVLRTGNGGKVKVPSKSISASQRQNLQIGKQVRATLSLEELKKANRVK